MVQIMESMPLEGYSYKIDDKTRVTVYRSMIAGKHIFIEEHARSIYAGWDSVAEVLTPDEVRRRFEILGIWDKIERKP